MTPAGAASPDVLSVSADVAVTPIDVSVSPDVVSTDARPSVLFDFDRLTQQARELSGRAYVAPPEIPAAVRNLTYDQWRSIRFDPDHSLWRHEGLPFEVQFFHTGFYYDRSVAVNIIERSGEVLPVPFSTDLFVYPDQELKAQIPASNLGFAGFRIHYPLNRPDYKDEVAVFLGASYFRAVGREARYGLSARGLALNTALPSGEEFPWFREFWIEKPVSPDSEIAVFAMLDSPSCTGAYRFVIVPGEDTLMKAEARIFFRKDVEKTGIAPMTSMYLYGETENGRQGEYRPEVHDSDGLLVHTGEDGWIWRALCNGPRLAVSRIPLKSVRGMGLLQRDRKFDHYQDLEAHYGERPSLWVEPGEGWGSGSVELIEIPSDTEFNDNIVAFWVPDAHAVAGGSISCSWVMRWTRNEEKLHGLGRAAATRRTGGDNKDWMRFIVDFEGGELDRLPADAGLTSVIEAEGARVVQKHLEKNAYTGGWRLSFQVQPDNEDSFSVFPAAGRTIRLSALLKKGDNIPEPLTETWSFSFSR